MNEIIKLEKVTKQYISGTQDLLVLDDISLSIEQGRIVSILGESGSGKSTLLNLIGGLDNISSGSIFLHGIDISNLKEKKLSVIRNKHIGFVFQNHHLLIEFSALENVVIPYLIANSSRKKARERALELLAAVGLSDRVNHRIGELSGGEQQRVSIARSMVNSPDVILADEPTGNLDDRNSQNIKEIFFKLNQQYKTTIVLVTHSRKFADGSDFIYQLTNKKLDKAAL